MSRTKSSLAASVFSVLGLILVLANVESAEAESRLPEHFQANVMATAGAAGGRSTMLEIRVLGWTSEEERQQLLSEIIESTSQQKRNRNRAVARALRGASRVGIVFPRASTGWPLHYAKEFPLEDGGRRILLATDRPVTFTEAYGNLMFGDFDVTIIELNLDKDGNGEGILSLGTEVSWNPEAEKLEVTNFSSQPLRLGNVRRVK